MPITRGVRSIRPFDLMPPRPNASSASSEPSSSASLSARSPRAIRLPIRRDTFLGPSAEPGTVCWENTAWRNQSRCPLFDLVPPGVSLFWAPVLEDGSRAVILENALVRVVISVDAGAPAFAFEDMAKETSIFTSVGALRDDVLVEPSPSKTDRIAKYTHQVPAGMFNCEYAAMPLESGPRAEARVWYDAPDVVPAGARFERTITLAPDVRSFTVDERVTFKGDVIGFGQRAVSVTSLAVGDSRKMTTQIVLAPDPSAFAADKTMTVGGNVLGFYDSKTHELATIAWRSGDVEDAKILERRYSIVTRLTLAPGLVARTAYGYYYADTLEAARAQLAKAAEALQGQQPVPANTSR